jgi:hypothetical protein
VKWTNLCCSPLCTQICLTITLVVSHTRDCRIPISQGPKVKVSVDTQAFYSAFFCLSFATHEGNKQEKGGSLRLYNQHKRELRRKCMAADAGRRIPAVGSSRYMYLSSYYVDKYHIVTKRTRTHGGKNHSLVFNMRSTSLTVEPGTPGFRFCCLRAKLGQGSSIESIVVYWGPQFRMHKPRPRTVGIGNSRFLSYSCCLRRSITAVLETIEGFRKSLMLDFCLPLFARVSSAKAAPHCHTPS